MRMGISYLKYKATSQNLHGIHSPFVYNLTEEVFNKRGGVNLRAAIALRDTLLRDKRTISPVDYGAGPRRGGKGARRICDIAASAATPLRYAALMQRLITYQGYTHILELGTSLGLATFMLASANSAARVVSVEGDPSLSQMAQKLLLTSNPLMERQLCQVDVINRTFESGLPEALDRLNREVHFAYIDGNHRYEPTLRYFEEIAACTTHHSAIAIGDIHWSPEMEKAWAEITSRPDVTVSIDLFYIGIIFFRKEQTKQHFTIQPQ